MSCAFSPADPFIASELTASEFIFHHSEFTIQQETYNSQLRTQSNSHPRRNQNVAEELVLQPKVREDRLQG